MNNITMSPDGTPRGLSTYTRILAAGETSEFNVRGNFLRVKDAPAPCMITLRVSQINGGTGVEFTNEMKKFEKIFSAMEYDSVVVTNPSSEDTFAVTLQLGYGDYVAEILSRTVAAPSLTPNGDEGQLVGLTEGYTSVPVTIPENLQRKRIKIKVYVRSVTTADGLPADTPLIAFVVQNNNVAPTLPLAFNTGYPINTFLYEAVLFDDMGDYQYIGEAEFEVTSAMYIFAIPLKDTTDINTDYSVLFDVRWAEELYNAS